jgi:hypothetical protein
MHKGLQYRGVKACITDENNNIEG